MIISAKARIAGVMGWPVGHSRSPRLHGHWLEHYRIDGTYIPLPVSPEHFAQTLKTLPYMGFTGVNVTVPHKVEALNLVDEADDFARRVGAVNTIVIGAGGRLHGSNTDGFGFMENLRATCPGWQPENQRVVLLGAGGAARAIGAALLDSGIATLTLCNRTTGNAETLAQVLNDGRVDIRPWAERAGSLAAASLLVNATVLGMVGQPPLDLALDALGPNAVVSDIVYVPVETKLLASARQRGNVVVDGRGMLLHQARPGFQAWFGVMPEVTPALRDFVFADLA